MAEHQVRFVFPDGEKTVVAGGQETILDAARRQGLNIQAECELGLCGTCKASLVKGEITVDEDDPEGLTIFDRRRNMILSCQSYAQSDLELNVPYKLSSLKQFPEIEFEATILELRMEANSVVRLIVDAAQAVDLKFRAGQYANITVPGSVEERSFSFANAPGDSERLEFLVRILPDGLMSNYLRSEAKVGQVLKMRAPHGLFSLQESTQALLFVAGGTGLGPFLSMLEDMANKGGIKQAVHLLYGINNHLEELCSLARLDELKSILPTFDYTIAEANGSPDWSGETGFVTDLISDSLLFDNKAEVYLCGPPPMIDAGLARLEQMGLPGDNIYYEKFIAS